jgi:hypothetical protein
MAYMSQENKKSIAPAVKSILNKYGMKGSLRVRNHSTLVLTMPTGKLDLMAEYNAHGRETRRERDYLGEWHEANYADVNVYWIDSHWTGENLAFLTELKDAMNGRGTDEENFDNSDIMTDYFHVGWYIDINIGSWEKPYVLID